MPLPNPVVQLIEYLNRPIFGTRVIPPNTTVSPSAFPQEEFPVYCPQCNYELRGLADNRCPECGQPFDRGRLLVDQYARERDHRLWENGRLGLWAGRLAATVLVVLLLWVLGMQLIWWAGAMPQELAKPTARQADAFVSILLILHRLMWWGQAIALVILLACVAVVARAARRNARKRQRVLDAIDLNE